MTFDLILWSRQQAVREETRRIFKEMRFPRLPCCCGELKVDQHHVDYDRPELIAFLCRRCHSAEHHGRLRRSFYVWNLLTGSVYEEIRP